MSQDRKGEARTQWQDGMGNIQIWDLNTQQQKLSKLSFTVDGRVWLTGLLFFIFIVIFFLCVVAHCKFPSFNKKTKKEKKSRKENPILKTPPTGPIVTIAPIANVPQPDIKPKPDLKPKPSFKLNKNQELVSLIDTILDTETASASSLSQYTRSADEATLVSYLSRESIDFSPSEEDGLSLSDYSDDVTIYKYLVSGPSSSGPGSPQMSERLSSRGGASSIYFSREECDQIFGSRSLGHSSKALNYSYMALNYSSRALNISSRALNSSSRALDYSASCLNSRVHIPSALSIESLDYSPTETTSGKDRPVSLDLSLVFDMDSQSPVIVNK